MSSTGTLSLPAVTHSTGTNILVLGCASKLVLCIIDGQPYFLMQDRKSVQVQRHSSRFGRKQLHRCSSDCYSLGNEARGMLNHACNASITPGTMYSTLRGSETSQLGRQTWQGQARAGAPKRPLPSGAAEVLCKVTCPAQTSSQCVGAQSKSLQS